MIGALSLSGVLNLLWLAVAGGGLAAAVRHGVFSTGRRAAVRRLMALVLAATVLFPCISATDDACRFEILFCPDAPSITGSDLESKPLVLLAHVFGAVEHYQAATIFQLLVVLCLANLVAVSDHRRPVRAVVPSASRDPPYA